MAGAVITITRRGGMSAGFVSTNFFSTGLRHELPCNMGIDSCAEHLQRNYLPYWCRLILILRKLCTGKFYFFLESSVDTAN